jgi:hypothetical protein
MASSSARVTGVALFFAALRRTALASPARWIDFDRRRRGLAMEKLASILSAARMQTNSQGRH